MLMVVAPPVFSNADGGRVPLGGERERYARLRGVVGACCQRCPGVNPYVCAAAGFVREGDGDWKVGAGRYGEIVNAP